MTFSASGSENVAASLHAYQSTLGPPAPGSCAGNKEGPSGGPSEAVTGGLAWMLGSQLFTQPPLPHENHSLSPAFARVTPGRLPRSFD